MKGVTEELLVEALGWRQAQQIMDTYGGTTIYLPLEIRSDHPLTELIGKEGLARLVMASGQDRIVVPRGVGRAWAKRVLPEQVEDLRRAGLTIAQTAKALRITERRVYQILQQVKQAAS